MSFSVRQQMIFWGVLLLSAVILLTYLGNILLPFIAGAALAYLLDPLEIDCKILDLVEYGRYFNIGYFCSSICADSSIHFINLVDQLTKLVTAAPQSQKTHCSNQWNIALKIQQSFNLDETNLPLGEFLNSTIIVLMSSIVKSFSSLVSIAA